MTTLIPKYDLKNGGSTPAGAVNRNFNEKLNEIVSVKDFGAVGNGAIVAGAVTGTNDTDAINAAIAACGSNSTLYFPAGMYIITPGGLDPLSCSVYGPAATAIASTWSTGGGEAIFVLDYKGEVYPVTLGAGVTGINGWNTFDFNEIIGSPDNSYQNIGIYCKNFDQSNINVQVIRGCNIGVFLDAYTNDVHMGTNTINISHLYKCDVGLLMQTGTTAGAFIESNRITGLYWYGFTTCALSSAGGGTQIFAENIIDVISIGPAELNASAILLGVTSVRNIYRVRSWDAGTTGTGVYIYAPLATANNLFQVPAAPLNKINWESPDNILDSLTASTDGNGRSTITGTVPPVSGSWRAGDQCWNTAPSAGGTPGWVCTTSGTPGTWKAMANLAA